MSGLILTVSTLQAIPSIGPSLRRLGNALAQFRAIFGLILLLVSVLDLLNTLFRFLGRLR